MKDSIKQPAGRPAAASDDVGRGDGRPRYEPPRIVKKRSVSRVTLSFTAGGVSAGGGIPGTPTP
jgi:hypothetical protein